MVDLLGMLTIRLATFKLKRLRGGGMNIIEALKKVNIDIENLNVIEAVKVIIKMPDTVCRKKYPYMVSIEADDILADDWEIVEDLTTGI
jgi:hypothetical protein